MTVEGITYCNGGAHYRAVRNLVLEVQIAVLLRVALQTSFG